MSEYSYRTPMGLPVRYTLESDTHIENEFLFGIYEWVFTESKVEPLGVYFGIAASKGFPNHVDDATLKLKPHYAKLSHDQTTAYFCYASLIGYPLKNIPSAPDFHPREFIFYGLLKHKFYSFLLLPFFYIVAAFSLFIHYRMKPGDNNSESFTFLGLQFQPKLSGELLYILRYETMKNDELLKLFAIPLGLIILIGAKMRFGSVQKMVSTYFYEDARHPILKNWSYEL